MIESKIINIYADGYERFAEIQLITNQKLIIHFIEYGEYLNQGEISKVKKCGDRLVGDIHIELVTSSRHINDELMFQQPIAKSSHINAIVEVVELIDKYSVYAKSSICEDRILIEFEDSIKYSVGDRIYIEGSLEMN